MGPPLSMAHLSCCLSAPCQQHWAGLRQIAPRCALGCWMVYRTLLFSLEHDMRPDGCMGGMMDLLALHGSTSTWFRPGTWHEA